MGITTRLFVSDAEGGWRRLALNAGYLASYGALPLPEFADQTITVAFAHVEVEGPRIVRLLRVERLRWRFDDAGNLDQEFVVRQLRYKFWPCSIVEVWDGQGFNKEEIEAIRHQLQPHQARKAPSPPERLKRGPPDGSQ